MKHFHLGAVSGVIAAGEGGADDVLFAFHNNSEGAIHIQRVRAVLNVVVPPTADQEIAIDLALATFGDDYTGGSNLSDPATAANYAVRNRNLDKARVLRTAWRPTSVLASGNVRIADTTALVVGASAPVVDAHGFSRAGAYVPADTAGFSMPLVVLAWQSPTLPEESQRPDIGSIPLEEDRGFVIRLPIVLGTAFTARLAVEVDWIET